VTALTIVLWIAAVSAIAASALSIYRQLRLVASDHQFRATVARVEEMVARMEAKEQP
jgi:hypothetical protein